VSEQSFHIERTFFTQVEPGSELVFFVTEFAARNEITNASFTALGALEQVRLSFFDRRQGEHVEIASLESTQELVSCAGIVTTRDGKPTAHIHAVVVDEEGTTQGGHVLEAKVLFAQMTLHQFGNEEM